MDKYEYRVKTEQLLEFAEKKQYRKAMEIADTIDWRRVKSASMLNTVSEVYEYCGEFQKSRDILFMAFDRSPGSRKVVYRLATLALKVNDPDEASDCYEEFVKLAPKDPNQYILKYRILKVQKAPLEEQIAALEEFKKAEYIEKWAYELAKLYHEAGMVRECLEECDDLILWFSEGKYVYMAMELKMKYKPLTPLQQEKYDKHTGKKTKDIVIPGHEEDDGVPEPLKELEKAQAAKEEAEQEEEESGEEGADAAPEPESEETEEEPEETEAEEVQEEIKVKPRPPITRIVTGATLEEALASGMAMAAGLNQEEKAMADRDEELKLNGQMKIEDILQEWEEKQKANADAIEKQKAQDKERLKKERQEAEKRKEASRKAAEEAARRAEEENRKKALAEAKKKAEEEAKKKKADEAKKKKAEETARKAEEAAKKAEEARKKTAEEAARKEAGEKVLKPMQKKPKKNILEEKTQRLPDDIMELVEQLESRVTGTSAPQKAETSLEDEFDQEEFLADFAADFAEAGATTKIVLKEKAEDADGDDEFAEAELEDAALEDGGAAEDDEFAEAETLAEDFADADDEAGLEDDAEDFAEDSDEEDSSDADEAADDGADEADGDSDEASDDDTEDEEDLADEASEDSGEESEDNFEDESDEDGSADDAEDEEDFADGSDEDESADDAEDEEDFDDESDEDGSADDAEDEEDFGDESDAETEEDFADEVDEESDGDSDDDSDDDDSEDDFGEEDFDEDDFDGGDFIEESDEDDFDDDEFSEETDDESDDDFDEEDFDEEDFEEDEFDEDELDEDDLEDDDSEEDFDEDDFDEDELDEDDLEDEDDSEEDFDEDDFDEDDFDEDDFIDGDSDEDDFEEDEFEEDDFEDDSEEDFDEDALEEDADEDEFEEEEIEEEEEEVSLEIEEPSEEEIQKRFRKAKGGGVPFDTGFVVTGRYDLSATSEIGLKAGLTEEQKKLFSYFVPVRGMSEQIVEALDNDRRAQREGTSKTGNLLVIGRKGSGKTVLAVDIVKAIQKQRNLKQGKVAIVTGESLNKKELPNIIQKLKGGAIIVEKAGKLNSRTVKELNHLMERKTGEMLFVLEDQRKPLERVLAANPEFKKKFTSKLELPIFINDELVTFGQTYAKENGYKLDEMGILALYSRIDVMQREDHAVSVAEVKEIMDEAISHSQRVNVKHLARRVFGKGTDDSDRIILKEEDFKI